MAATIRWFYQRISGPVTQAQNRFRKFIENIEQKTEPRLFLSQNLFKYLWSPWKSSKDKQILNYIIVLTTDPYLCKYNNDKCGGWVTQPWWSVRWSTGEAALNHCNMWDLKWTSHLNTEYLFLWGQSCEQWRWQNY